MMGEVIRVEWPVGTRLVLIDQPTAVTLLKRGYAVNITVDALNSVNSSLDGTLQSVSAEPDHKEPEITEAPIVPLRGISALRDEYTSLLGKKPFHGWDEAELTARIETAQAEASSND